MIRERVSTSGVTRGLELEGELAACNMPHDRVAKLSDDMLRRYVSNKRAFDRKFQHVIKGIEEERLRNLAEAKEDTIKRVTAIRRSISPQSNNKVGKDEDSRSRPDYYQLLTSPSCSWSWLLDERENPPPSSIVGRRDISLAIRLATAADWCYWEGRKASYRRLISWYLRLPKVSNAVEPH